MLDINSVMDVFGITLTELRDIKRLVDTHYLGKVSSFIRGIDQDKKTIFLLRNRSNRLKREIVKLQTGHKAKTAKLKLPLLTPIISTTVKCASLNLHGYRCSGGADEDFIVDWCKYCSCYSPE